MISRIAHRGASGYEVENSLSAFNKAVELKVDYIEMDVQVTKDRIPVIRHDKLLDRTTNLKGAVNNYSLSELKKNGKLSNGEEIPTLEEACEVSLSSGIPIYIDLKAFDAAAVALEVLKRKLNTNQFIFGAFHSGVIKNIKQLDSSVQTVLIIEGNLINFEKEIIDCQCDIIALGFDAIEKQTVRQIQSLGKKVFTWTVNTATEIAYARELGVNGITSNYPDLI